MNQTRSRRPFDPLPIPHYHAIAGLRGYLPSVNVPHETIEEAAGLLAKLEGLGQEHRQELIQDRYLDLEMIRPLADGNDYLRISMCFDQGCSVEGNE